MILPVPLTPPIIGITGGIGSGKSFVASLFAELGCFVISSDAQVRLAYDDPHVRDQLRGWWGDGIFRSDGTVDRKAIAKLIFSDENQRLRLEQLLHPLIAAQRDAWMQAAMLDPGVKAIVWDTPLLHETGLDAKCDVLVFVDAPPDVRFNRVRDSRGWDAAEINRREILQWPLDKKRSLAHYVVVNTADAGTSRSQVREILSRILAN
jgi:dephospho-CoA kinase